MPKGNTNKILLLHSDASASDSYDQFVALISKFGDVVKSTDLNSYLEQISNFEFVYIEKAIAVQEWEQFENFEFSKNISLVISEPIDYVDFIRDEKLYSLCERLPFLVLPRENPNQILKIIENSIQAKHCQGLLSLIPKGSQIFTDKIQRLDDIGHVLDKLVFLINSQYKEISSLCGNVRTVVTAVLFEAFKQVKSTGRKTTTLDFQVACTKQGVTFNLRFSQGDLSFPGSMKEIISDKNISLAQLWRHSDCVFITEYEKMKEIDLRATIGLRSLEADWMPASVVISSVERPDSSQKNIAKEFKFFRISNIELPSFQVVKAEGEKGSKKKASVSQKGMGTQINYQLRVQGLEQEKETLQALVKKKNVLLAELNKSLAQAQKDISGAKSKNSKELMTQRAELTKAKKVANDAIKKMRHFKRLHEERQKQDIEIKEKEAEEGSSKSVESLEYDVRKLEEQLEEKLKNVSMLEEKNNFLRESETKLKLEVKSLKYRISELEKTVRDSEQFDYRNKKKQEQIEKEADIVKEQKKEVVEAKNNFVITERELKATSLKLEAAEKQIEGLRKMAQKQLENVDKKMELAQKREQALSAKIEELKAELSKKGEAA